MALGHGFGELVVAAACQDNRDFRDESDRDNRDERDCREGNDAALSAPQHWTSDIWPSQPSVKFYSVFLRFSHQSTILHSYLLRFASSRPFS